jgi:methyl-accepting chemotaxis protein
MAEVAAKLADGDVEQEVTHHSKDEVGQLADSFRNMVAYIKGASAAVAQIGSGQTRVEITPRSDKDHLSHGIQGASGQISYLVDQVMGAAFACRAGQPVGPRAGG